MRITMMAGGLAILAALAACTSTAPSSVAQSTVGLSAVSVSGSAPSRGGTSQLTATATYADGRTENVTSQATWSSSDTNILTISPTGLATGVAAGTTFAQATYQGQSGILRLQVTLQVAPAPSILQTTTLTDSDFAGSDWDATVIENTNNGAESELRQDTTGGDRYRSMIHDHERNGTLTVYHLYNRGSYDPHAGAIDSIAYSERRGEFGIEDHDQEPGARVQSGVLLQQGGKYFLASLPDVPVRTSGPWLQEPAHTLRASDLRASDGTMPDFSSAGGSIRFGYWRRTTAGRADPNIADGSEAFHHAIDDWTVVIAHQ